MTATEPSEQGADRSGEALRRALLALKAMKARVDRVEGAATEPIAIIGAGCRFPGGADSPDAYWELLRAGRDGVGAVPAARWDHRQYFDRDPDVPGKIYTDQGGFLDGPVDEFDAGFFGIAPVEARDLDPQQRLLLEVAWETLENGGVAPDRLAGSPTGVFVGIGTFDYSNLQIRSGEMSDIGAYNGTGVASSVAAGRISYVLGLRGPSIALDTACSSSLVALALAVQSLRAGACRMALAGGVNLILEPQAMIFLSKFRALSPTGRCHTFGADADGYVRGEGCGMVLLKRLSDAQADGDRVLAVIRGESVNHDGRSGGLTVPSGAAQREVIEQALAQTGLLPTDIDVIEAHGTGTQLGDPIEVRALDAVYSNGRSADHPLLLGSAKTNIGHLETAAGIAGVLKAVLALQHEQIPPHLHCEELSPHIDWKARPIEVNRHLRPWPRTDRPRRIAVSAFGFSGTNAHVILEEAPPTEARPQPSGSHPVVLALSGRDEAALGELAEATAASLDSGRNLADLAWTLQHGRARFAHRLSLTATSPTDAATALRAWRPETEVAGLSAAIVTTPPRVGFIFTGQGSQLPGMGRDLYAEEPVFRQAMDEVDALLRPLLPHSLLDVLYGPDESIAALIHRTQYTQPAMFALQVALTALWRSWGIEPHAVAGHSIGEYAAAVAAGVMDLATATELIAARGRLMGELPDGGRMVAVFADEGLVRRVVEPFATTVAVAAANGGTNIVISGGAGIDDILANLDSSNVRYRALEVSHAFHSPLMKPMLAEFARHTDGATFHPPQVSFISAVTGQLETDEIAAASYWRDHVLATVRFGDAVDAMLAAGVDQFVEIGPQPTLLGMVARARGDQRGLHASLRSGKADRTDQLQMTDALGSLWAAGVEPDWAAIDGGRSATVDAPTYPFQRQRYWIPERAPASVPHVRANAIHPLLQHRLVSPAISGHVYESQLSATMPAYFGDHRIFDAALLPATGYLELALVAGREAFGDHVSLSQVALHEMLILPETDLVDVQVVIGRPSGARAEFSIFSRRDDRWLLHASGFVDLAPPVGASVVQISTGEVTGTVDPAAQYEALAGGGVAYGPSFQTVTAIERGHGFAIGELRLPSRDASTSREYLAHPALLDGCLQLIAAATRVEFDAADDSVFLPIGVGEFHVFRPAGTSARAVIKLNDPETSPGAAGVDGVLTADIELFGDDGALVASMRKLKLRRVGIAVVEQMRRQLSQGQSLVGDSLYEVGWVRLPAVRADDLEPVDSHRRWLVIPSGGDAEAEGFGDGLAAELRGRGARVVLAEVVSNPFEGLEPQEWAGVVIVAANDRDIHGDDLLDAQRSPITSTLDAVHGLLSGAGRLEGSGRLWLLTRNAQSVDQQADPVDLVQAPLWGLANSLSTEEPGLRVGCIDLPPRGTADAPRVVDELLARSDENRIAFRGGHRLAPRLVHVRSGHDVEVPSGAYALDVGERGTLDGITLVAAEPLLAQAGGVVIEVRASGLNFRDVLNVMGMYPGVAGDPGSEIAGVITAVGEGVVGLEVGDEVIAIVDGSFRREAAARADVVFPLPANVDFATGAAMPIAFLTTHYGLHHLAHMRQGDTVLIHAAAGGVGMAAVQLAQLAGATIIGTAGSDEKRSLLRSIGVPHVLDSRSLEFVSSVREITEGRGVDIALNSLSDDFIPATLGLVADGGTFLEIGKRGVWSDEQVAAAYPTIRYHLYDLSDPLRDDTALVRSMMLEVLDAVSAGRIPPMPRRLFPIRDIRNAFRHMAMARHVGKVVITQPSSMSAADEAAGRRLSGDGSYVISGGLGSLGLHAAAGLVRRGARHIALLGRRAPSAEAEAEIDALREAGAQVAIFQGDVSDAARVVQIMNEVRSSMAPIRGVVHAAGVLDDGLVRQLDWSRFESVMRPKVVGAWNLHRATIHDRIELFVMYSSVASLLGSPGQANYAAANAFLDALAHHRQAVARPALSINWAGWSDIGMAARLAERQGNRRNVSGVDLIDSELGDDVLGALIGASSAQVGVLRIDWSRIATPTGEAPSPLLEQLIVAGGASAPTSERQATGRSLAEDLATLAPEARFDAVRDHVRAAIVAVLGLDSTVALDGGYGLPDLGMDSLMAVELSNRLGRSTGLALASTVAFEHPSLEGLSAHLANDLLGIAVPAAATVDANVAIPRVPRDQPLVASAAQQRLLFIDQLQPGTAMYNIPAAHRLTGALDVDALEGAFTEIVRRHETLRTNFDISGEMYTQRIVEPAPLKLRRVDLRHVPEVDREAALTAELHDEAARSFDVLGGPKIRTTLVQLAEDEHVLVVVVHHIAIDGWSVPRLYGELVQLYQAAVDGTQVSLPELEIQYADYAAWQRAQADSHQHRDQLAYWTEHLRGRLPVLEMPTDRPRPALRTYGAGSVRLTLPSELMAQVTAASRSCGVTPFVFLMASYVATVARWVAQDDIIVGTAAANRARPETTDLIGLFANTLAVRVHVDAARPFTTLLDEVRAAAFGAFAHQDVPFNSIVEAVRPVRDLTRSALFQTMFIYNNVPMASLPMAGLSAESIDLSPAATEQDLSFSITEAPDRTLAEMQFNTDVFDAATVQRLLGHWGELLRGAIAGPATAVGSLPLLSAGERRLVLEDWARHGDDVLAGVPVEHQRIERLVGLQMASVPDAVAVVSADETLTYRELDERSNELARHLQGLGVGLGDRVGVAVERSAAMVVSLLAVMKAGAAYVPLDLGFPAERLAFMVADAGVQVVLVSGPELSALIDVSGLSLVDIIGQWSTIESLDPSPLDAIGQGGDVAYVIYTSGSTGTPKGVEIEHRSVVNFLHSMALEPGLAPSDVLLAVTTLSFDISVLELFLPLSVGATAVVASREDAMDARRLISLIDSSGATVMQATPTTWSMLFDFGWPGVAGLKVLCGGEAMPHELGARLLSGCGEVWNMFGPTETTIWSTIQRIDERIVEGGTMPIGRPIANTVVRVLDSSGRPTPIGVPGELFIGGASVARGYLGRAELTAERFVADPFDPHGRLYRTGDVVRWRADGHLEYVARADDQVKVRGFRIELGEIESALRGLDGVKDAVVTTDGAGAATRLLAYAIPADASVGLPPTGALRTALQQRLPDYMVPARFIEIDAFPTTPNRKIDRKALPAPDTAVAPIAEHVEPASDTERLVARFVAETLGCDRVGAVDNFFDLGGQSLHAMSVVAKLAETFGVEVPLRAFFVEPTVRNIGALLSADPVNGPQVERVAAVRMRLDSMSPEQVSAMLAARRADVGLS